MLVVGAKLKMKTIKEYLDKAVLSELEAGYVTALKDVLALIDEITPVHIRMGSNTTAIRELKKRIEG